jgi:hypothetical protein
VTAPVLDGGLAGSIGTMAVNATTDADNRARPSSA